jgi:TetR/AcrR family transcriptional regulator, transcriptional repressor of aconitase
VPKVSDAHRAARRQQILDAAAACFARDGFHRTSMQDIVRASSVSAGLVYRYFASKDDIIAAIVSAWHEQRSAAVADDPAQAYLRLLRSVGDPDARESLQVGVQVWAEAVRSARIRDLVRDGVDGPRKVAAAFIIQQAPGIDADALARVLIAMYQGLLLQTVWDDTLDNAAYVAAVESLLARLG